MWCSHVVFVCMQVEQEPPGHSCQEPAGFFSDGAHSSDHAPLWLEVKTPCRFKDGVLAVATTFYEEISRLMC